MSVLIEELSTNRLREALRLLRRAMQLLESPELWTQHCWARNAAGKPVLPEDPAAVAFCLTGAVLRAEFELHATPVPVDLLGIKPLRAPVRVTTALLLLADPLLAVYRYLYAEEVAKASAEQTRKREDSGATDATEQAREARPEPELIAAAVNDQERVRWEHVIVALKATITLTAGELRMRRNDAGDAAVPSISPERESEASA